MTQLGWRGGKGCCRHALAHRRTRRLTHDPVRPNASQFEIISLRDGYGIDYVTKFIVYDLPSSLMEGRLPETILKGGAGSGVLRPRLVTAGSGGPGHRPPGMTTWLRGARCTDPEAMPEMEARPPAENRHGGAPRGERPASWDAPRLTRADPSRLANATTDIVRLSALRPPLFGSWTRTDKGPNPGATTRRGNEQHCAV